MMELSSATHTIRKRKSVSPEAHDDAKRLKTVCELDEAQRGASSHPPKIFVQLSQQPITLNELTELLHYAALGKKGGIVQPSWCRLRHQKRIKALNIVIVEGLTQSDFYNHFLSLRRLRTTYTTRVTFTPSSTSLASDIFSSQVPQSDALAAWQGPGESSQLQKALRSHPVIMKFGAQKRGLTAYLLTQEEKIKQHYPVKGIPGFEEFQCTDSTDQVTDSSPLYGLDCEMCLTEKGYELARVSLVDSDGKCILEELVKPPNRVFNYLTKFSGITAKMLRPITTSLRDVQVKLQSLLPADAVLVGHSVNNDLKALKLIHPHIIDTSLLYRREFGQKFKLKVLAEVVLQRQIQMDEGGKGHNPTEDAVAALELAQYFIKAGPRQYGYASTEGLTAPPTDSMCAPLCKVVALHLEKLWGYKLEEGVSDPSPGLTVSQSSSFADVLATLGHSVVFIGRRSTHVQLDPSYQLWLQSDKQVLSSFITRRSPSFLSVLQLSSSSCRLETLFPHSEQHHQRVCGSLRRMSSVFAGPFPACFSEGEVRRLFTCCGPIHRVHMLVTSARAHARIEFQLLEGAVLAIAAFNGLDMNGHTIKVQRPVDESTLDLDVTLDALVCDGLNSSRLQAVVGFNASAEVKGQALSPFTANGTLHEEKIRETFARFGPIRSISFTPEAGRRAGHAQIVFERSQDKQVALSYSEELKTQNFLVCPAVTPPHLPSWAAVAAAAAAAVAAVDSEQSTGRDSEEKKVFDCSPQGDLEVDLRMQKLDRRLGKLFRSLPDGTLSVVLLPGRMSGHGHVPGLCFLEVKQAS